MRAHLRQPVGVRACYANGRLMSYFAEAPGPSNEPPPAGPVLVMPPAKNPKRPHRWLQRLWLVVFVLFCLEVGIILTVLPWTQLWTDNSLLVSFPASKISDLRLRARTGQRPRPDRHLDGRRRSRHLPRNPAQLVPVLALWRPGWVALACSNCPTEHQETAGCDPASSDADGNSSPVRA